MPDGRQRRCTAELAVMGAGLGRLRQERAFQPTAAVINGIERKHNQHETDERGSVEADPMEGPEID